MSKLFRENLKKTMIVGLLLMSSVTMLSACTQESEEATVEEVVVETAVDEAKESIASEEVLIASGGEKLSQEDRRLVDDMLKRMEVAINKNDTALFSAEFKLLMSDYTDEQINDINIKLLAFVEEKHNFYFYDILNEDVDTDGNKVIIVRMGYKNIDDAEETNEYVQMLVEANEESKMNISKIFFLDEEQYAPFVK